MNGITTSWVTLADESEVLVLSFPLPTPLLPRTLTDAERSVVLLVLEGKSNAQIAAERATSIRTTANQVASAFKKLGVRSRGELAARYIAE